MQEFEYILVKILNICSHNWEILIKMQAAWRSCTQFSDLQDLDCYGWQLNISTCMTKLKYIQGEIRNKFNLISEKKNKFFFKDNSENLMKIGWKIRKLWHFKVSQIFTKHFLTSRYEHANEWGDDVITSLLAIYIVHKMLKICIFCPNLW